MFSLQANQGRMTTTLAEHPIVLNLKIYYSPVELVLPRRPAFLRRLLDRRGWHARSEVATLIDSSQGRLRRIVKGYKRTLYTIELRLPEKEKGAYYTTARWPSSSRDRSKTGLFTLQSWIRRGYRGGNDSKEGHLDGMYIESNGNRM